MSIQHRGVAAIATAVRSDGSLLFEFVVVRVCEIMKTEAVAYAHTCDRAERILFTALQLPSAAGEDRSKARHRRSPYHIPAAK